MSKVNFFKPEDFEGFGLLAGDRDGIAEFANAKLKAERDELKNELLFTTNLLEILKESLDFRIVNTRELRAKLDVARAALEFYASALEVKSNALSGLGEPNKETHLLPVKLGTRAREALEKLK